jgi:hypothetical protein
MIKNKKTFNTKKWTNVVDLINNKVKSNNNLNDWISLSAYTTSIAYDRNKIEPNLLIIPYTSVNNILNSKLINKDSKFVSLTAKIAELKINEDITLINELIKLSFLNQVEYNKTIEDRISEYKTIWRALYSEYKHLKYMDIRSIPSNASDLQDITDYINLVDNNIKKID